MLDPRDGGATVGGLLATGLSGHRRLRHGPLRDRVLEVRFVTADGRLVKGGGPTVKNVSGFDLPRLLVGSLGPSGCSCRSPCGANPCPRAPSGSSPPPTPSRCDASCTGPRAYCGTASAPTCCSRGSPADVATERARVDGAEAGTAPAPPAGPHRGRISVRPSALRELAPALDSVGARWLAEVGVGTVHVATDDETALAGARAAAVTAGGWLLREAGAPGLDGFGGALPNAKLMGRVFEAFDPDRQALARSPTRGSGRWLTP